jgi:hypothetical protein
LLRIDADELALPSLFLVLDYSGNQGKQRIVGTATHIGSRLEPGSPLPYKYLAPVNGLAAKSFDAESLSV